MNRLNLAYLYLTIVFSITFVTYLVLIAFRYTRSGMYESSEDNIENTYTSHANTTRDRVGEKMQPSSDIYTSIVQFVWLLGPVIAAVVVTQHNKRITLLPGASLTTTRNRDDEESARSTHTKQSSKHAAVRHSLSVNENKAEGDIDAHSAQHSNGESECEDESVLYDDDRNEVIGRFDWGWRLRTHFRFHTLTGINFETHQPSHQWLREHNVTHADDTTTTTTVHSPPTHADATYNRCYRSCFKASNKHDSTRVFIWWGSLAILIPACVALAQYIISIAMLTVGVYSPEFIAQIRNGFGVTASTATFSNVAFIIGGFVYTLFFGFIFDLFPPPSANWGQGAASFSGTHHPTLLSFSCAYFTSMYRREVDVHVY